MASSTPGPYKSRLFSFLNRQSQQLKDRLERGGRHLKMALEWGVQIMIYPMYLMVQAGRMAGRQFGKAVDRAQLPASSSHNETSHPTSDRAIAQILEAVEIAIAPTPANPAAAQQPQTIVLQGIASLLQTKALVLVAENNRLVETLSQEQQDDLNKLIAWELANYWYERRIEREAANPYPELVSSEQTSDRVLPPARLFWKVIRWVQTSPVAKAINLFGESFLADPSSAPERTPKEPGNLQAILQAAVNYFFGTQPSPTLSSQPDNLLPQTEPQKPSNKFIQAVRDRVPQLLQELQANFPNLRKSSQQSAISEPDPFQIQAIIQAAIDYFFGQRPDGFQLSGNKTAKALSSDGSTAIEDPWLVWNDLFTEVKTETASNSFRSSYSIPMPIPSAPGKPVKSIPSAPGKPAKSKRSQRVRDKQLVRQRQQLAEKDRPTAIARDESSDSALEVAPDWIETKATPVGYVKHPLEKVLEWIDRAFLWLENLIANLWKRLRRRG